MSPPPPPPLPQSEGRSIESISPTPITPSSESNNNKPTSSKGIRRINDTTDEEGFALDTIRVETDVPPLIPMPPAQSSNEPVTWHKSVYSNRTPPTSSSSPQRKQNLSTTPSSSLGKSAVKRMINGGVRPASVPRSMVGHHSFTTRSDLPAPDRTASKARGSPTPAAPKEGRISATGPDPFVNTGDHSAEPDSQPRSGRVDTDMDYHIEIPRKQEAEPYSMVDPGISNNSNDNRMSRISYHAMERTPDRSSLPRASSDVDMASPGLSSIGIGSVMDHDSQAPAGGARWEKSGDVFNSAAILSNKMLSAGAATPRASSQRSGGIFDLTLSPAPSSASAAKPVTIDLTSSPANVSAQSEQSRASSVSSHRVGNSVGKLDSTHGGERVAVARKRRSAAGSTPAEIEETDLEFSDEEQEQEEEYEDGNTVEQMIDSFLVDGSAFKAASNGRNLAKTAAGADPNDQASLDDDDTALETFRRKDRERESEVDHIERDLEGLDRLAEPERIEVVRNILNRTNAARNMAARDKEAMGRIPVSDVAGKVVPLSEYKNGTANNSHPTGHVSALPASKQSLPPVINPNGRSSVGQSQKSRHNHSRDSSSLQGMLPDHANDSDSEWTEDENSINNHFAYQQEERRLNSAGRTAVPIDPLLEATPPSSSASKAGAPRFLRNSRDAAANYPLLGLPDAWPKDGRNVNLKHIQAYYGLSQDEAKEFLTNGAVAKAMDRINQLKAKYEKPSVPAINTVRQAFKYDAKFSGLTPKDFISEYRQALCDLTIDVPSILYNPRTKEKLKDDDMGANAHSVLLAAKRYRNRIEGTIPSAKKSPTVLRTDGDDGRAVEIGGYHQFFSRQDSPTEIMRPPQPALMQSPTYHSSRVSRGYDGPVANTSTDSSSLQHPHQSVTLPFRREEEAQDRSNANHPKASAPGISDRASEESQSAHQANLLPSPSDRAREREESMPDSVTSMNTDDSILQPDEPRLASTTSLSTVTAGQTDTCDDMSFVDETTAVVTTTPSTGPLARFGRRKPGAVSLREHLVTEMASMASHPARNKAAQLRLARNSSNTMLEKINAKRAEKVRNEKELEELEDGLNRKLSEITRKMDKMRTKAAFHSSEDVDLLTDEDFQAVEGENGRALESSSRQLGKIDWEKYQELADERMKLEHDSMIKRTRLIANGKSIDNEREDLIKMRHEVIGYERALEEAAYADGDIQMPGSPGSSSFKMQEDPMIDPRSHGGKSRMGDQLLELFESVVAHSNKRTEQVEHGYSTRKRIASVFANASDLPKRRKM